MVKMGRPGAGRAKDGRLRGAVRPELKREMEGTVRAHPLFRSVSQLMEIAATYYLRDLKRSNYSIDTQGFPILPPPSSETDDKSTHLRRSSGNP